MSEWWINVAILIREALHTLSIQVLSQKISVKPDLIIC